MARAADNVGRPQTHAHTSRVFGIAALLLYTICATIILTKQPLLNALCAAPLGIFAVAAYPRHPERTILFRTPVKSIAVFAVIVWNLYLSAVWSRRVVQFIYVAIYAGFDYAAHDRVQLIQRRSEYLSRLSNGLILPAHVWLSSLFVGFLLVAAGLLGLSCMAERFVGMVRDEKSSGIA